MTISVNSSSNASGVQSVAPQFGHDVKLMNPDDIIAYVSMALGNIGDRLNDYKELVTKQQNDAKEIRQALVLARQLNANGGDFTAKDMPSQGENYNQMMSLMARHLDNPNVKAAYESMLKSYGPYTDTKTKQEVGKTDGNGMISVTLGQVKDPMSPIGPPKPNAAVNDAEVVVSITQDINKQDAIMDEGEMKEFVNSLNDALSGLDNGNELMMMELQSLMQVRNQVSQFASNNLKALSDTANAVIGNMRG